MSSSPTSGGHHGKDESTTRDANGAASAANGSARLHHEAALRAEKRKLLASIADPSCTFHPSLTSSPSLSRRADDHLPASERLYRDAAEQARKLSEAQELALHMFTFAPAINRVATTLQPTYKENAEGHRLTANELLYDKAKELRLKAEERSAKLPDTCVFHPEITKMARALKRDGDSTARLYDPESVRARKDPARNNPEGFLERNEECTFHPRVNELKGGGGSSSSSQSPLASLRRSKSFAPSGGKAPMLPASPMAAAAGNETAGGGAGAALQVRVSASSVASDSASASPTAAAHGAAAAAGPGSSASASAGATSPTTGSGRVFDRLYDSRTATAAKLEAARAARSNAELDGATFHPDLTASKASVARLKGVGVSIPQQPEGGSDAFDRLYSNARERLERTTIAASTPFLSPECTFRPKISDVSRSLAAVSTTSRGAAVATPGAPSEGRVSRHTLLYEEGVQKTALRGTPDRNKAEDMRPMQLMMDR